MIATCQRQQCQDKYQNPHTADPVGKASPDVDAVRHLCWIRKDTGTGCGKTGNDLKKSIDRIGDSSAEYKRHSADNTENDPA